MATGGDVPSFSAGSPYPTCSSEVSSQAEPTKLESSQSLGSSVVSKDWDTVPQPLRSQWTLATRTGLAKGWFWAHGYDVQARGATNQAAAPTWLCYHCVKQKAHKPKACVSSNSRNIEGHLSRAHNISNPDQSKLRQDRPEPSPRQPKLFDFDIKKRKRDDFHDGLAARFDKITFQRLLVRWVTEANLSFRISEHEGLHKLLHYLNPLVEETSANLTHKTIRTSIVDEFYLYKSHIVDTLLQSPSQVHIAFDGWTSRNRHSFFSINAFFLDERTFTPRKTVLGLPSLSAAHTGENISATVAEVLEDFELVSHNKVGYFILDNASNNDRAVEDLGRKFRWGNPSSRRIRCFGHILHLVARAMLFISDDDALEGLDADDFGEWAKAGPVGKLHNLVVWVHRSTRATATLRKLQEEDQDKDYPGTLDVVLDNSTRWLSQYYMIERALKLRRYLDEMIDITIQRSKKLARNRAKSSHPRGSFLRCLEGENMLTDADWDALSRLKDILAMFDACLLRLEGDGQVRLRKGEVEAQYGIIWQVAIAYKFLLATLEKAKLEAEDRPKPSYYSSCVNSAWAKLNKYYVKLDETPVYYAATVLHPGIKWAFLSTAYAGRQDWLCKARELVQALWDREYRDLPIQWQIADSNLPVAVRARESNPFDFFQDELLSHTTRDKERIADEFERWLSTSQDVCTKHDNPLPYWSAQRFEYPRVARMAIDVLSIPAMSAECERTFSSAGAMVSPRRTRLDASTISVAQTVRSWLNAGLLEGYDGLLKEVAATIGTTD
ncbi:putative AC transposase [Purpureocillium lavendulum]|uniref:AC transposase n=1 Tax=Purpureocillium lavendulum TaxID=1247861 RepID=A0AB34FIY8_9HYPO|nr:putative AC transposase [Purpureocillium lavendulum]